MEHENHEPTHSGPRHTNKARLNTKRKNSRMALSRLKTLTNDDNYYGNVRNRLDITIIYPGRLFTH